MLEWILLISCTLSLSTAIVCWIGKVDSLDWVMGVYNIGVPLPWQGLVAQLEECLVMSTGPEVLLKLLSLNPELETQQAGEEPQIFILPLLLHPHPSPLSHFIQHFLPLSEQMFNLQQKAEEEGQQAEAKVWSVLIGQVRAGFVGYCYAMPDLPETLTAMFSQLLFQLLYTQPGLWLAILKVLKTMVDSNTAISIGTRGLEISLAFLSQSLSIASTEVMQIQSQSLSIVMGPAPAN
ncbi:NUC173 domain-containing protein [Cyathus striatus]|nr:NUC173 domain-containing protein [Cyathus striatus]